MHDSYDNPPNIPLITDGNTKKIPNQSTPTGAVVTVANAIASALKPPEAQSQSQQNSTPKLKKKTSFKCCNLSMHMCQLTQNPL